MHVLFLQKTLPQEMLGPAWLTTALKRGGHRVSFLMLPAADWEEALVDLNPDLLAVSVTTGDHGWYRELCTRAKQIVDVPVVWGGAHPTFVPNCVADDAIDYVIRGEGEGAITELADTLEKGAPTHEIRNLSFMLDGERIDNPLRPLNVDLDEVGVPDRGPLYEACEVYRSSPRKIILTQRGCLYNCSFCFHHAFRDKLYKGQKKSYLRKRTVTHVIEEVNALKKQGPLTFIHFLDDIFNVDDEWMTEFTERWPKEVGLPFDCILRTNLVTEVHARQLKEAGCCSARIAFESASNRIRNDLYRKGTTLKQLRDSARFVRGEGIRLTTLNLLGAPGATLEEELATLQLNVDCGIEHPLVSLLQPYPETDMVDLSEEMGYAVDRLDDFPEKFNRTSTIQLDERSRIENLQKLFPIVVRFPILMPLVRPLIGMRFMSPVYLAAYLLWNEYLVCEQNRMMARSMGTATWRNHAAIDFLRRVSSKAILKVRERFLGKDLAARIRLTMEEDTIAHMGG